MENTDSSRIKVTLIFIVSLIFVAIVSACVIVCFVFRESRNYDEAWIIGKTKDQIVEKYGDFESYYTKTDSSGNVLYSEGFYTVKSEQRGFLGTDPPIIFRITFNKDGAAYKCYEGYPEGWN